MHKDSDSEDKEVGKEDANAPEQALGSQKQVSKSDNQGTCGGDLLLLDFTPLLV